MKDCSFLDGLSCDAHILRQIHEQRLGSYQNQHYLKAINTLPSIPSPGFSLREGIVEVGGDRGVSQEILHSLGPWKKGPFRIGTTFVDGEWQCHWKWDRFSHHLPNLEEASILDVGCNNGYFMFRLAEKRPRLVLGIDPIARVFAQFHCLQHFARAPGLHMGLWGVEELGHFHRTFDLILSMGILYHHKNPLDQIRALALALKPRGTLILETMGIPGESDTCLSPKKTYARMRNVWFVPTLPCLLNWLGRTSFRYVKVLSSSPLTTEEQRATPYSSPVSLKDFLHPEDKTRTIEGYKAPWRFCLLCRKEKKQ